MTSTTSARSPTRRCERPAMRAVTCWCRWATSGRRTPPRQASRPTRRQLCTPRSMPRLRVVVVDGNHQAWLCLKAFQQRDHTAAGRAAGRALHLGGSLWSADHRSTRTRTARPFGALGGAASPHQPIPSAAPHHQQQADNHTTRPQPAAGQPDGGLDALICHDAPESTSVLTGALPPQMPNTSKPKPTPCRPSHRQPPTPPNPSWHSTRTGTNRTDAASTPEAKSSHSQPTVTPNSAAVLSIRSLRTRYSDPRSAPSTSSDHNPDDATKWASRTQAPAQHPPQASTPTRPDQTPPSDRTAQPDPDSEPTFAAFRPNRSTPNSTRPDTALNLPGFHTGCLL